MDKIYNCTISCTFRVRDNLTELIPNPNENNITGFILPDGRVARPIIGLEIENKDGSYKNLISQGSMAKVGFDDLEYDISEFTEDEDGSEGIENEEYELMPIENLPANMEPRFPSTLKIIEQRLKEMK